MLLTGDDPRNQPQGEIPKSIFVTAYAPYSQVFPRAAVIVHQGGIGTTGQAMAAGVPMLIVPYVHDQPDNAHRAARLGLARVESREKYTAERAAFHLRALLTQPEYAMRAKWAQGQMATEDGIGRACAAIERLLDSRGSTTLLATSIGTHG